jgi:autotransporter passenger strand-loop-strand repeat protein
MTTYTVLAGQTISGLVLNNNDVLNVTSGGTAVDTQVSNFSFVEVFSGGTTSGTILGSQGNETVSAGGKSFGTVLSGSGASEEVYGTASGTLVGSGGDEVLWAGATASGVTVLSGGRVDTVDGGQTFGTILRGGIEDLLANGVASGTVVSSGGNLIVNSGDTAINTVISAGGIETVYAGGITSGAITFAGPGTLELDGGSTPGAIVSGFVQGDTIDLPLLPFTSSGAATLTSGNVLAITEGGQTFTVKLDPAQSFAGKTFVVSQDHYSDAGTQVTVAAGVAAPPGMNQTLFQDTEQLASQAGLTPAQEQALVVEANNISRVLSQHPVLLRFIPSRVLEAGLTRLIDRSTPLNATQSDTLAKDILANPYAGKIPQVAQPNLRTLASASTNSSNLNNLLTTLLNQQT